MQRESWARIHFLTVFTSRLRLGTCVTSRRFRLPPVSASARIRCSSCEVAIQNSISARGATSTLGLSTTSFLRVSSNMLSTKSCAGQYAPTNFPPSTAKTFIRRQDAPSISQALSVRCEEARAIVSAHVDDAGPYGSVGR